MIVIKIINLFIINKFNVDIMVLIIKIFINFTNIIS